MYGIGYPVFDEVSVVIFRYRDPGDDSLDSQMNYVLARWLDDENDAVLFQICQRYLVLVVCLYSLMISFVSAVLFSRTFMQGRESSHVATLIIQHTFYFQIVLEMEVAFNKNCRLKCNHRLVGGCIPGLPWRATSVHILYGLAPYAAFNRSGQIMGFPSQVWPRCLDASTSI